MRFLWHLLGVNQQENRKSFHMAVFFTPNIWLREQLMCIFHQALTGSKCFKLLMMFVTEMKSDLKELFFVNLVFCSFSYSNLSKNHGFNQLNFICLKSNFHDFHNHLIWFVDCSRTFNSFRKMRLISS